MVEEKKGTIWADRTAKSHAGRKTCFEIGKWLDYHEAGDGHRTNIE